MKIYLFIIAILFCQAMKAPTVESLYIIAGAKSDPYARVKYAIGMVESSLDTMAYFAPERATGYFQITPIRLRDYNQRTGSNLQLHEMFDYAKAETVFMYYVTSPYDIDGIILRWNCNSYSYLKKVKQYI